VNGAYPDLTNVILGKINLAPVCGGGNMDLGASRVRKIIAAERKVPVRDVQVLAVGHHGSFYTAKMDGPSWYRIIAAGEDVSEEYPVKTIAKLYDKYGYANMASFPGALVDQMKTASSFLKITLAVYYNTREVIQSLPAPNGLPGAYPCILGYDEAKPVIPGLTLKEAVKINEDGAKIDGIEKVKADGTVVFCEENVKQMREVVGYECPEIKPKEHEERAKELDEKLKKLYAKYNVSK
jgi:malate/lactate dehydrogenase